MPCEKLECCRLQSVLLAARPVSVGTPCLLFSSCSFSRSVYYLLVARPVLELRVYYLLVARHSVSVGTPCLLFAAVVGYRVSFNDSDNSSYCPFSCGRGAGQRNNVREEVGGGGACSVSDQTCSHCYWGVGVGHVMYQPDQTCSHCYWGGGGGGGHVMYH